ncbi:MAG: proline dehydrogenase family protein [Nocardioidaceae bacterium]|nr:proline dehydrogenase family protein [Nocardioidaceae bacterium]
MLRRTLLALARSERMKGLTSTMPVSSGVVARFVAGESAADAVRVAAELSGDGLQVSLDHLGEDTRTREQAEETVEAYGDVLRRLGNAGLTRDTEVSVKLSAIGQALSGGRGDGDRIALDNARRVCRAARNVGTTVTLDMEDHTTTDATLDVLADLRLDFPETGAVLQSHLRRTEGDCKNLAHAGSRVRLCKGAYKEPDSVAYQDRVDVDRSYVRCLKVLMNGAGHPMVATHDPRLIRIAGVLADRADRASDSFEYQMLYGVRPDEQLRLSAAGSFVRVYVPYGDQWYGYLVRRLAERPANVAFFARSLLSRG